MAEVASITKENDETDDVATIQSAAARPTTPLVPSAVVPDSKLDVVESKDLPEELDLDFEEISDGELEEEARIRGLGDALGVDWASLVEESKAIAKEKAVSIQGASSAKQRWQPHRILLDVGVSFRMAGKEFASNVLNIAHRKLKEEQAELKLKAESEVDSPHILKIEKEIKKEIDEQSGDQTVEMHNPSETMIKEEPMEQEEPELLIHPIACVQVASRVNAETRKNLIFNATGPYCRALSARRDIEMRRQLCGLPITNYKFGLLKQTSSMATYKPADNSYALIARQLFEKALAKVN